MVDLDPLEPCPHPIQKEYAFLAFRWSQLHPVTYLSVPKPQWSSNMEAIFLKFESVQKYFNIT